MFEKRIENQEEFYPDYIMMGKENSNSKKINLLKHLVRAHIYILS